MRALSKCLLDADKPELQPVPWEARASVDHPHGKDIFPTVIWETQLLMSHNLLLELPIVTKGPVVFRQALQYLRTESQSHHHQFQKASWQQCYQHSTYALFTGTCSRECAGQAGTYLVCKFLTLTVTNIVLKGSFLPICLQGTTEGNSRILKWHEMTVSRLCVFS